MPKVKVTVEIDQLNDGKTTDSLSHSHAMELPSDEAVTPKHVMECAFLAMLATTDFLVGAGQSPAWEFLVHLWREAEIQDGLPTQQQVASLCEMMTKLGFDVTARTD